MWKNPDVTQKNPSKTEGETLLDGTKVFNYMLYITLYSFTGGARFLITTSHILTHILTHSEWVVFPFLICALSPEGRRRWFNLIYTPLWPKINTTWLQLQRFAQVSRSGVYDLSPNEGPGHDPSQGRGSASKP